MSPGHWAGRGDAPCKLRPHVGRVPRRHRAPGCASGWAPSWTCVPNLKGISCGLTLKEAVGQLCQIKFSRTPLPSSACNAALQSQRCSEAPERKWSRCPVPSGTSRAFRFTPTP